jgi:drug/metabolite transporter (DMT)-like permease
VVLWASAFVAIRRAGGHFAPGALVLGRLLVASLALGVVWPLSGGGWPARAAWPGILGSSATRPGLRTVQRGPLMLVYLTDVRGERVVIIQVNWIG